MNKLRRLFLSFKAIYVICGIFLITTIASASNETTNTTLSESINKNEQSDKDTVVKNEAIKSVEDDVLVNDQELVIKKDSKLASRLKGKILLQVESHGEAWYVSPKDSKRYYMANGEAAYSIMRDAGVGITNKDINKIPAALNFIDGLEKLDSDNDGFDDKLELQNNYNPHGSGKLNIDKSFANKHKGKIFLQVESHGEAWYISPSDGLRYYLGTPDMAFNIMRSLGLGISDKDIKNIEICAASADVENNKKDKKEETTKVVNTEADNVNKEVIVKTDVSENEKVVVKEEVSVSDLNTEEDKKRDLLKSLRQMDTDGDRINDYDEIYVYKTDPKLADTDSDGLSDYDEIYNHGTDPLKADTDGDGLSDYDEIRVHRTDPLSINNGPNVANPNQPDQESSSDKKITRQNNLNSSKRLIWYFKGSQNSIH